jgi:hypothetical protein
MLISGLGVDALAGLAVDSNSAPAIKGESSSAGSTSAKVSAMVDPEGSTSTYHVEYGTTTAYGHRVPAGEVPVGSDESFHQISQLLSGLKSSTTYHWRIVATNGTFTTDGSDQMFTTTASVSSVGPPVASTGHATGVSRTGATLNGTVNPHGMATTYHFEYGPTTTYGTNVPSAGAVIPASTTNHAEAQQIGGLKADTTYHFRIVATNAAGTSHGADQTFTTPPLPPIAVTGEASALTSRGATLNGKVNPSGSAARYYFQYGTGTDYAAVVPVPAGSAGSDYAYHAESQPVSGLQPATTYHFRIVASSAGGTAYGSDRTFTTAAVGNPGPGGKPKPHPRPGSRATRPVLRHLNVNPSRFRAAGRGATIVAPVRGKRRPRTGAQVSYSDSTAATTTFTVLKVVAGVRHGRGCVRLNGRAPRHARRCSLLVRIGTFTHRDVRGRNSFRFSGRLRRRKLSPGSYVLRAIAAGRSGKSAPVSARFRIVR